jgi:DNA-binding response OmpR family regulator
MLPGCGSEFAEPSQLNHNFVGTGNKESVLIIDDEIDICFLLGGMLRRKQFPVSYANSLAEGIDKIDMLLPSIIFLDINLPDGVGLDHIKEIKVKHPGVRIIMISAYDSVNERTRAASEGADHFISKPFNKDGVYSALEVLFKGTASGI